MPDRTLIMAVDPGYTTGLVLAEPRPRSGIDLIAAIEFNWSQRFDVLGPLIATHADQLHSIVLERFQLYDDPETIRAQIGSEFPSCRVIGNIETYAIVYGLFERIVYQQPWAKSNPKQIEARHWSMLGGSFHNADAYRHAWFRARQMQRGRAKRSAPF